MKKKIAIITTNITNSGGTERVIANFCNMLAGIYEIEIHSLSTKNGGCFYPIAESVSIIHMGMRGYEHVDSILKKNALRSLSVISMFRHIKKIEADIFIGVNKNISIILAATFYLNKNKKIIGWEHFAHNAPMSLLTNYLRDKSYKRLNSLIVLTDFDRQFYIKKNISASVIPNSISPLEYNASTRNSKRVLAVGRHTHQKRFDRLLNIWSKVIFNNHSGWVLNIIGEGPLLDENKKIAVELGITETVSFQMPTKDIASEYSSSSFLVMTSDYEAFPMVLLEALSCGLPCLAYDCDTGPRDIIISGEDGFVIPYCDEKSFVQTMNKMMLNPELVEIMGEKARLNIQRFSDENIKNRWIQLFESL